jgi:hypothetical protein
MAIQSAVIDHVVFIRWSTQPSAPDLDAFDAAMSQARKEVERPLFHVALLPTGIEMPPVNIQKPLIKRVLKLRASCESMHCVVEGGGIKEKLGRRFLNGMVRMFGLKEQAFVHATAAEALTQLKTRLGVSPDEILSQAQAKGLLG